MKPPVVDYRQFRLSRLSWPEFEHIRLLGGWIVYFLLYYLTERRIPPERFHEVHCALDDVIPFCEGFAIFYCYWFLLLIGALLYLFLYDVPRFKQLQVYIILTQLMAMAVYIAWPSVQRLRPETFPRDNALTRLMGLIYRVDTPTGVCPSLHVAYSVAIASVWLRNPGAPPFWKAWMAVSAVLISLSVAFVKQHSCVDILAALPMCALCEALIYGRFGGKPGQRLRSYLSTRTI